MSQAVTKHSKAYLNLLRSDVANYHPKNIFLREPNVKKQENKLSFSVRNEDVLRTTVHRCTEPYNNTELFIVGTLNNSNVLANRTRRLIDDIKPDVVFVQTTEPWWQLAQNLEYVKSQEEMDKANNHLSQLVGVPQKLKGLSGLRFQMFNYFAKIVFSLPLEFNPFLPGLEVKYTLEEATKLNSKIVFLEHEFNDITANKIKHDRRFTIIKAFSRLLGLRYHYHAEANENRGIIQNKGFKSFCESSMDSRTLNWYIKVLEIVAPEMKRIFVDQKDEELFKKIQDNHGKRMVAVVNQHHMEGIEHHWCNSFGTVPTYNNPLALEKINPIGDMPLRRMLYEQMYHVIKRDVKTSRLRSSPASFTNDINIYHREFNHQYEHRNM
mmetsp:Transcript_8923/g.9272  ORF Transcript_8923/g.9272 Transcript_8923/m.9272 type:complete len:381 (-) Transcript_8923:118-1260(-)